MRHVLSPDFLARKLDGDVRRALALFREMDSAGNGPGGLVQDLTRALTRVGRLLKVDTAGEPGRLLDSVIAALRARDEDHFRRRTSEERFVRGRGERIWSSSTGLFATMQVLLEKAARVDSSVVTRYYADSLPEIRWDG